MVHVTVTVRWEKKPRYGGSIPSSGCDHHGKVWRLQRLQVLWQQTNKLILRTVTHTMHLSTHGTNNSTTELGETPRNTQLTSDSTATFQAYHEGKVTARMWCNHQQGFSTWNKATHPAETDESYGMSATRSFTGQTALFTACLWLKPAGR